MLLFLRENKRMGKIVTKSVDMNANILYLKHEIVADTSKTQARIEFRNMAYGTILRSSLKQGDIMRSVM